MSHTRRSTAGNSARSGAVVPNPESACASTLGGVENVGNAERVISGVLGGLLLSQLSNRSLVGGLALLAGCGLVYRAFTGHCPLYEQMGCSTINGRMTHVNGSGEHLDTVDLPELSA